MLLLKIDMYYFLVCKSFTKSFQFMYAVIFEVLSSIIDKYLAMLELIKIICTCLYFSITQ